MSDRDDWLSRNHSLRMDANSQLFPQERRTFHLDRYRFAEPMCSGLEVLDGACGTGYGTALLATTAKTAVGIDCSTESIAYARQVYARPNTEFLCSYVEHTPFQGDRFDVVVSFETIEHTLCPQSHVMEIVRILKPSGKAILSVPNAWGYTDHHFFDFDFLLFRNLVNRFFASSQFFLQNPSQSISPGIRAMDTSATATATDGQCIIAICDGPQKEHIAEDRYAFLMDEIYANAFLRHNEYRTLLYRQQTPLFKRALNKARTLFQ